MDTQRELTALPTKKMKVFCHLNKKEKKKTPSPDKKEKKKQVHVTRFLPLNIPSKMHDDGL